jgi:hypothetical protein
MRVVRLFMNLLLRVSALLTCILFNSMAFAQSEIFPSPNAATKSLFPNDDVGEWVSEEGDLNNDGVKDVAMIITFPREVGEQGYPLEKKVLVLGLTSASTATSTQPIIVLFFMVLR